MTLQRIVSGGQTGVDRGALDAALDTGFPCGGWCPERRMAEDGALPERYPLATLAGAGYEERTLKNVLDSDGMATLNVAGPRASKWPGARDYAYATVTLLLESAADKQTTRARLCGPRCARTRPPT